MRARAAALLGASGVALAAGCWKSDDRAAGAPAILTVAPATSQAPPTITPAPSASVPVAAAIELQVATVGDTMSYAERRFSVPSGATIHVTMKNNATLPTLSHRWVLVKPGSEARVAAAALSANEASGYLAAHDENVLAATGLAPPGETTQVTFTAPAPGNYPFICTFPGHYMMEKGVLTVTP